MQIVIALCSILEYAVRTIGPCDTDVDSQPYVTDFDAGAALAGKRKTPVSLRSGAIVSRTVFEIKVCFTGCGLCLCKPSKVWKRLEHAPRRS